MNIFLDTNIWIYLTKSNYAPLWDKLNNGHYSLLTNDIIIEEWKRNKETTIKSVCDSIKNEYKTAQKLSQYLAKEDVDSYNAILSKYQKEEFRIQAAEKHVDEVEKLLLSTQKVEITQEQITDVAQMAIKKIAPLNTTKNNFNDALIIRSLIEFSQTEKVDVWSDYNVIFVSNNPKDFLDENGNIHSELLKDSKDVSIKSVTELGEALQISDEDDEEFDRWLEDMLDMEAMRQLEISLGK